MLARFFRFSSISGGSLRDSGRDPVSAALRGERSIPYRRRCKLRRRLNRLARPPDRPRSPATPTVVSAMARKTMGRPKPITRARDVAVRTGAEGLSQIALEGLANEGPRIVDGRKGGE